MSSRIPQLLALSILGLIAVGSNFVLRAHHPASSFEQGYMPTCDSSAVRQLLKQTLEQPDPDSEQLRVLKLVGVSDVSAAFTPEEMQARPDRRRCAADTITNAGRGLVVFQIDWTDGAKNDLYLETLAATF